MAKILAVVWRLPIHAGSDGFNSGPLKRGEMKTSIFSKGHYLFRHTEWLSLAWKIDLFKYAGGIQSNGRLPVLRGSRRGQCASDDKDSETLGSPSGSIVQQYWGAATRVSGSECKASSLQGTWSPPECQDSILTQPDLKWKAEAAGFQGHFRVDTCGWWDHPWRRKVSTQLQTAA